MDTDASILVVGSINMDLVVRAPEMPAPGQTVLGEQFTQNPGGKGANQAVAIARLGGRVEMIGRVGSDPFGQTLRQSLAQAGVDVEAVFTTQETPTGVAMIVVNRRGENSIVVASGANACVSPDDLYSQTERFERATLVLVQLELPLPTIRAAIALARQHHTRVILDPAPVPRCFPDELYDVDLITPNVGEAEQLTGKQALEERLDKRVATMLIERGAKRAVLKLGSRGSLAACADGHFYRVPAYQVAVVDTTAAGDAFTGALAFILARGGHLHDALKFANAAGALACSKFGAQASMPSASEVKMLMDDQPR